MRLAWTSAFLLSLIPVLAATDSQTSRTWHIKRQHASDLEVGGALAGLTPESTRYLTRDDLLAMPQVTYTVQDDLNFAGSTRIRGVRLEELARGMAASPASAMVIAICDDGYAGYYPRDYLAAHHPVLVLEVNGKPPAGWPKAAEDHTSDMGPYLISHPKFAPSFKILSHVDEAQVPWGVVKLEFRDEADVLGAIAPRGSHAKDADVQAGYRIAAQNCLRCHNVGSKGGQKSRRSWEMLGGRAAASPKEFAAYIRSPLARNPGAQMPANLQYDDATLAALTAYFRTFSPSAKP